MLGLITRSAVPADVPAIHRLIADGERHHGGRVLTAVDAVAADLARPTLDPARDTLLVYAPQGELVGWSWMHIGKRAEVHVHPDHEGRGLGTGLLAWTESQARATGSNDLGQTINDANTAATALLHAHGYRPTVTQWQLEIDLPTAESIVPEGIDIRPFRPGDEQATYRMAEVAFMDWQERDRSYAEWSKLTIARDTFAPALSPLAFDGDRLVGAVLSLDRPGPEGHIERVAVDREYRRRGIAQALLRQAFAGSAGFARSGKQTCTLWTHSKTGALDLYERAGMTVRHSATHVRKPLTSP